MSKKYAVKDLINQLYFCGNPYGWSKEFYLIEYFNTIEDAESFISKENGIYQIETMYYC